MGIILQEIASLQKALKRDINDGRLRGDGIKFLRRLERQIRSQKLERECTWIQMNTTVTSPEQEEEMVAPCTCRSVTVVH
jgi:hypothetical protein